MKKIEWSTPARPAIREDYFSSLIGPEMDADKAVEIVDRMQKRVDSLDEETVSHGSSVLLEMVKLANELSGMDNTLTKREVYARVNPSRRSIFIAQVVYHLTK